MSTEAKSGTTIARLTARETDALKAACHFALDDDPEAMPTHGPLIRDMRRALAKLEGTTVEHSLKCLYCERVFKSRQDLRNHVRQKRRTSAAHGKDGEVIRSRVQIEREIAAHGL